MATPSPTVLSDRHLQKLLHQKFRTCDDAHLRAHLRRSASADVRLHAAQTALLAATHATAATARHVPPVWGGPRRQVFELIAHARALAKQPFPPPVAVLATPFRASVLFAVADLAELARSGRLHISLADVPAGEVVNRIAFPQENGVLVHPPEDSDGDASPPRRKSTSALARVGKRRSRGVAHAASEEVASSSPTQE